MTTNTISSTDKRWQEIKDIWKKDSWLYGLTGLVAGFIFGVAASSELRGFVLWFCQSFWTDTLSIAITVLVIDRLNRLRDREAYKQELFRQAKSRSNDFAVDALRQIQDNGWWGDLIEHYPSTSLIHFADLSEVQWAKVQLIEFDLQLLDLAAANLREANLVATNLQRANLRGANLQGAWLDPANLQHTRLLMSNLQHSRLSHANLQQTELENANLQQANLREANLQEAYLREANLQGVDLYKANLQETNLGLANLRDASLLQVNLLGAKIDYAQFDEKTLLPDAQKTGWDDEGNNLYTPKSYWTPKTDMRRYTDPEHPDFWEPDYLKSDYVLTGLEPQWIKDWHEKKRGLGWGLSEHMSEQVSNTSTTNYARLNKMNISEAKMQTFRIQCIKVPLPHSELGEGFRVRAKRAKVINQFATLRENSNQKQRNFFYFGAIPPFLPSNPIF